MQSCRNCNSTWNSDVIVDSCPFCGKKLNEEIVASTIEEAFEIIFQKHGQGVFGENRLIGLLSDYAPSLGREKKLVKIAVESGAYKAICSASTSERKHTVEKYISILSETYFIDENWAKKALLWCLNTIASHNNNKNMLVFDVCDESYDDNTVSSFKNNKISRNNPNENLEENRSSEDHTYMSIFENRLKKYNGNESIVVVPYGIEIIDMHAFYVNQNIRNIIIPSTVKTIARSAFAYCPNLECIEFSEGLKSIEDGAFIQCKSIKSLKFPQSLSSIGESAFRECSCLERVELPESFKVIKEQTFQGCRNLKTVIFSKNLLKICQDAFKDCASLKEVAFTDTLIEVEKMAFDCCVNLDLVTISKKTNFHSAAFGYTYVYKGKEPLIKYYEDENDFITNKGIIIEGEIMTVDSMDNIPAFFDRDDRWESVKKIIVSDGVEVIEMEAFAYMKELKEVVLPSRIKKIGFAAFKGCSKLRIINFPEGITTIAAHAFESCVSLKEVILPDSLKYIGDEAFWQSATDDIYVQDGCVVCRNNYRVKKRRKH